MKKLVYFVVGLLSLIYWPSVGKAAYSASGDGLYLDFDLGSYTRRIEENCPQCTDSFGNTILKVYGNGDSTRLLVKLGLRAGILDAYLTLGGATLTVEDFDGYHGDMSPAYGGGLKFTMYQSPYYGHFNLFVNPDILYFKTSDTITFNWCQNNPQCPTTIPVTESHDISFTEYGVKIGGSARYEMFEPFGGVSVSFLTGAESGPVWGSTDIKERDNIGLFAGGNFYFDPASLAALSIEFGGGDENYFKVGIKARF